MSDTTTVDMSLQQSCDAAMLHANVEVRLLIDKANRLESENAKLRERNCYLMKGDLLHVLTDQEYIDQCERERLMQVSIDALDEENARLRELMRILLFCQQYTTDCDDCKINGGDGKPLQSHPQSACDELLDRMRELGIDDA